MARHREPLIVARIKAGEAPVAEPLAAKSALGWTVSESDLELGEGSGNVFGDLGDPNADLKQAKANLAARIIVVLDDRGLSVRKARADRLCAGGLLVHSQRGPRSGRVGPAAEDARGP